MGTNLFLRVLFASLLTLSLGCQSAGRATSQSTAGRTTPDGAVFREKLGRAEKGDAEAQCGVGKCYGDGLGVARDEAEAVKWFRKAAEQGNAPAQCNLGLCYFHGKGVDYDGVEAVKWFRKAAEQTNAEAETYLGLACMEGRGVRADLDEGDRWLEKAAKQGNAKAQGLRLGFNCLITVLEGQDGAKAGKELRKCAEQGNAIAETFLGLAYFEGSGVTKDYVESVRWFRRGAAQENGPAQAFLGLAYFHGWGVFKSNRKAVLWSRRAAEQGVDLGQETLGRCYQTGKGVGKDPTEAVKWFRKSAMQGGEDGQLFLGLAYRQGQGIEKDYVQAYKWLDLVAARGNSKAVSAREEVSRLMTPEQLAQAGVVPRRHLTQFDRRIIDAHEQRYSMSCIPSSVEMVLKLMGRVPGTYYEQQTAWKNKADGSFHNFDGKTIEGVTFHQQFTQEHNGQFLAELFATIDRELGAGRFVIVGLAAAGGTHDWVIYDEDANGDFLAVSKGWAGTIEDNHVRKTITEMGGTDIGTYDLNR